MFSVTAKVAEALALDAVDVALPDVAEGSEMIPLEVATALADVVAVAAPEKEFVT